MEEQVIEVELNEDVLENIEDEVQEPVDINIEDIIDGGSEIDESKEN